jgi:tRNA dimethylallyltransferase
LQTIGFKEFIPYLEKYDKTHDNQIDKFVESNEVAPEPEGYKTLLACLDELKLVTRRYSKRQLKWINNRFLGSEFREVPSLYSLDTSDVSKWKEIVYQPAEETVTSYIIGEKIKLESMKRLEKRGKGLNEETSHYCNVCERVFVGDFQWQIHVKSNKHKHKMAANRRREKLEKGLIVGEETKS